MREAPDGGQRGVLEAYYRARRTSGAGPSSPLVAYQLNWKGENFYTGNDVAIFVSSGPPLRAYLEARARTDPRTVYFVTEAARVTGLRAELGPVQRFEVLTDSAGSSEFCLVRAELAAPGERRTSDARRAAGSRCGGRTSTSARDSPAGPAFAGRQLDLLHGPCRAARQSDLPRRDRCEPPSVGVPGGCESSGVASSVRVQ